MRLVAYIGGVKAARSVTAWAAGKGQPGEVDRERLRHAYHAAAMLGERFDPITVQSWFKGKNPMLDGDAPAEVLRAGDPLAGGEKGVLAAARRLAALE